MTGTPVALAVTRVRRILFLLLLPIVAYAEAGFWGARGISRRFAVRGDQVFDADGRGLAVYDVRDPAKIARVAVVQTDAESLDLAFVANDDLALLTRNAIERYNVTGDGHVSLRSTIPASGLTMLAAGKTLLAMAGDNGVTVSRPNGDSLETVARLPIRGKINAMAFRGDQLWIAVESEAIYGYDFTRGAEALGVLAASAGGIAIRGDTLYAAAGVGGLVVADIADVANPRVKTRTGAGLVNLGTIAVAGDRAYAVELPDNVRVYDLTQQRLVQTIRTPAQVVAASSDRLFVAGEDVDAFGLTRATGIPLQIYVNGQLAGEARDLAGPVSGVATDGTLAYVADPPYFRVIDVSSPATPRELASIAVDNLQDFVKVQGRYAIVYGRGDVDLIDVLDPYRPKLLGRFVSFGRPPSNAAFTRDTILEGNPWSGFHVIDFFYPGRPATDPVQISGIKGHYYEVVARADAAYIFELTELRVVDLANRNEANVVKEITLGMRQAAVGSGLLLIEAQDGMRVLSLARPLDPVETAFLPLEKTGPFAMSGDAAYVATPGSVVRIDLTSPARPAASVTAMTAVAPMQVAAAGGKVVIADRYGLRVFGSPSAPPPPPAPARVRAAKRGPL